MVRGAPWLRESHVCWQRCACADPARASITTTSMLPKQKFSALQEVRKWNLDDVLTVLSKNGLKECCESFKKREIDGDTLLALTEGKLALWKRDLTLTSIRKLTIFVQDLNTHPDKYVDREKSDSKLNSLKVLTHLRSPSSSSHSDTASWNTDFEDEEEEEDKGKQTRNAADSVKHQSIKSLEVTDNQQNESRMKPPIPLRPLAIPPRLQGNTNDKPLVPIPPVHLEDVTNIISNLAIPVIEERTFAEQFDDEFYESFDGENVADLQRLKDSLMSGMPNESPAETVKEVHSEIQLLQKESIAPPLPSRSRPSSPGRAIETLKETTDQNSPPTPPPRNPPVNMFTDVKSFLHSSATSLNSSVQTTSNSSFTTPRMSLAFSEPEEEYEIVNENTEQNSSNVDGYVSEEYESIQEHNILPPNNNNNLQNDDMSEEYESIKEHTNLSAYFGDEYYLQPDPRQPIVTQKMMDQGSLDNPPPLPAKPKAEVSVPPGPPPSPPRRRSEDSSSSTTSGSGDSMSGRIGGLLRKVINRPAAPLPLEQRGFSTEIVSSPLRRAASLNVSTRKERSLSAATISYSPSAPTQCSRVFLKKQSEAKKSVSLPVPTKPPVERPLTFQRPLPPTPEGKQVNADKISSTNSTKSSKIPFSQLSYYHNVDRSKAEEMLKNSQDGSFIVRPSAKTQNPLTLTLWFRTRIYNINIRHRSDGKYALGTEKANEQSFNSVEELISNYQMEKLVLYSGGERTGKALLTGSPRKDSTQ